MRMTQRTHIPRELPPFEMRVYLSVPYADIHEAKQMGAKWDGVQRKWWIHRHDLAKCPAVHRWIKDNETLVAKLKDAVAFSEPQAEPAAPRPKQDELFPIKLPDYTLPTCGCTTPAWEHCEHTLQSPPTGLIPRQGRTDLASSTGSARP